MKLRAFSSILFKRVGRKNIRRYTFDHSRWFNKSCNIFLIGYPGSGKTSLGRILGPMLSKKVVDIDDDFLEPYWGMTVGEKLFQIGGDQFIEEEGRALLSFKTSGSIVSMTGSNPLHVKAMESVIKSGLLVFLDCPQDDIIQRLHQMKVDRIVGQERGESIEAILKYRQQFYEKCYDMRILCENNETVESITYKVLDELDRYHSKMVYRSTRGGNENLKPELEDVVLQGLAEDGGLFVPQHFIPVLTAGQWKRLVNLSYQSRALCILEKWIHPSAIHPHTLKSFINEAYSQESFDEQNTVPVVHLHGNQYVAEVFHGPTASFKDAALQLMPKFFTHSLRKTGSKERYLILVATSGDTGSAVLDGFSKLVDSSQVKVMVLYPENGVSSMQKALMTSVDSPNVKVLGINGDFDECQSAIKIIFNDKNITERLFDKYDTKLSAANSINWGRLLPQVVYHASAYLDLVQRGVLGFGDPCDLCIPTGNFGNILGAIYAKEMGIPFSRFICASNVNNVLTDFLKTGVYDLRERQLRVTSSPAIDILKSSNLERFLYLVTNRDSRQVKKWYKDLQEEGAFKVSDEVLEVIQNKYNIVADWCSEEECSEAINNTFKQTGYLLDPHTAVAKAIADRFESHPYPTIICGTAHYAKFPEEVLSALGHSPQFGDLPALLKQLKQLAPQPGMHPELEKAVHKPQIHNQTIGSSVKEIVTEVENFISME